MANDPLEKFTAAAKANAETLAQSGNAAIAGFQELGKAYQTLATKNAEKLSASIQALASVKTVSEFSELQQKLIKEAVESAVDDSRNIAELTASVFTAAFEPVQKQVAAFQETLKK